MVHHRECPLCSSSAIELLFRCSDHFVSGKEFPVFKCLSCRFSFTQDYPEENQIGEFYESDDYISHSDTAKGFSNKLYLFARKIMLRKKRDLVSGITGLREGAILDIGSGTGYFASTMKEAGWNVKGIEVSEKARDFSKSKFALDIVSPGMIPTLESSAFDCITLWHVLEHFHDPFSYITEIRRLMKPGSFCIIALPNSNSYDAKNYGKYWAAWDVPRHLWHFDPSTFSLFCEKSGLTLAGIRSLPLDVFYISQLSEKYKGSAIPFLRGMLRAAIFTIGTFFNRKRSSSIVYILRKPSA
jgi:SAM-dependent methyltransferase